jgi:hypothetical protein
MLSPHPTHNLKRFGDCALRMGKPLEGWIRDAPFGQGARPAGRDGRVSQLG